jgi:hypothetical protein
MKNNLEIKKVFSIDGIEYNSKEEALIALATSTVNKLVGEGVEAVILNNEEFISALKVLSTGDTTGRKKGETLKSLEELLSKEGIGIRRNAIKWPLYHITLTDGEVVNILFKGKVWELYEMYVSGGINEILKYKI